VTQARHRLSSTKERIFYLQLILLHASVALRPLGDAWCCASAP
jgi:hypothetical protein